MFLRYIFNNKNKKIARQTYHDLSHLLLNDDFFKKYDIPDNIHSRFDLMLYFLSIYIYQLENGDNEAKNQARLLSEEMIFQFKLTLRNLNIAETQIGKNLKPMINAFWGRYKKYKEIFAKINNNLDINELVEVIQKNIYAVGDETDLAKKENNNAKELAKLGVNIILDGHYAQNWQSEKGIIREFIYEK